MVVYSWSKENIGVLVGKTLSACERQSQNRYDERVYFKTTEGDEYEMVYEHDCCANCNIEDIVGDLSDLVGVPILMAEDVSNEAPEEPKTSEYGVDSYTWTFVKFATAKGYVTVRWYGTSNGYYSESPTFRKVLR